jgi:hypothetical protein
VVVQNHYPRIDGANHNPPTEAVAPRAGAGMFVEGVCKSLAVD